MKKIKNQKTQTKIELGDIINVINEFRSIFQTENDFLEFRNYMVSESSNLIKNQKDENNDNSIITILINIKILAYKYISLKVRSGDINLGINLIDKLIIKQNIVKSNYQKWLKPNQQNYLKTLERELINDSGIELKFIKNLLEKSIIDTLDTYEGNDLLHIEVIKNLKNQMIDIEYQFEKFLKITNKNNTIRRVD